MNEMDNCNGSAPHQRYYNPDHIIRFNNATDSSVIIDGCARQAANCVRYVDTISSLESNDCAGKTSLSCCCVGTVCCCTGNWTTAVALCLVGAVSCLFAWKK
jgi:hypothetical protein